MARSVYVDFSDITQAQKNIMLLIQGWVRDKKTPMPHQEILKATVSEGATKDALQSLLKKGYIRRAYTISNKTYYVQLRTI